MGRGKTRIQKITKIVFGFGLVSSLPHCNLRMLTTVDSYVSGESRVLFRIYDDKDDRCIDSVVTRYCSDWIVTKKVTYCVVSFSATRTTMKKYAIFIILRFLKLQYSRSLLVKRGGIHFNREPVIPNPPQHYKFSITAM